jgi:hypothetical protein
VRGSGASAGRRGRRLVIRDKVLVAVVVVIVVHGDRVAGGVDLFDVLEGHETKLAAIGGFEPAVPRFAALDDPPGL